MKVTAIIAEYNPLHSGHKYHMEEARRQTQADFLVILMSGNYVQRGTPALLSKQIRCEMALAAGADLVLELPLTYACSSAEFFADGAINLLNGLGVVDNLCFGCETPDAYLFDIIAEILLSEPLTYQKQLKEQLKQGFPYPAARSCALLQYIHETIKTFPISEKNLSDFLNSPNNILGIEYAKAIRKSHSRIKPVCIQRVGSSYHDTDVNHAFCSASALRELIEKSTHPSMTINSIKELIPEETLPLYQKAFEQYPPLYTGDFSLLLKYKLMQEDPESLTRYLDMPQSLSKRIYNQLNHYRSWNEFVSLLKTKEFTYTRIQRALLHTLLELTWHPAITYARILGFRKSAGPLLNQIKNKGTIPLLSKLNSSDSMLSPEEKARMQKEIHSDNLYSSVFAARYNRDFVHEQQKQIIIHSS